ncbi:hypothetical protein H632_c3113p1 [Helicosporidium sp. ATCC 50920]|nr:hypothetical protein H632_c3113p1 [Helicosporidium sp. ATCC 50920]|eukprot:KDD72624.1 hypothetical protein H632_c3113p1 [Helicosporidium sp. ATCC 50920]
MAVRRALQAFNEDDETRVLLLSHRTGAAGLTLVRASHVFLLEPSLDPAIEQQAVARVHRIGQRKPVHIHRLVVAGSIEEAVLARQEATQHVLLPEGEDACQVSALESAPAPEHADAQEAEALLDEALGEEGPPS